MPHSQWKHVVIAMSLLSGTASFVLAQDAPIARTHVGGGFAAMLDRTLGLTPEQRDAVHGILSDQHQQSQSLRESTDGKIRALLTPEQQKKFDDLVAKQKAQRGFHRPQQ